LRKHPLSFNLLAKFLVIKLQFEPEFNKAVVCKHLVVEESFTLAMGSMQLFKMLDALDQVTLLLALDLTNAVRFWPFLVISLCNRS